MVSIRVPNAAARSMRRLAQLSASDQAALVEAVESHDGSSRSLGAAISERVPELEEADARQLVQHLLGLAVTALVHEYDADDVAEAVAADESLELPEEQIPTLRSSLSSVLGVPEIRRYAKAVDLLREQNNLTHSVRIITDMRPAFDVDLDAPKAAVLLHSLRLSYYDMGEIQTFSAALDHSDLVAIRDTAERALLKHEQLSNWLATHEVQDLTTAIEDGEV